MGSVLGMCVCVCVCVCGGQTCRRSAPSSPPPSPPPHTYRGAGSNGHLSSSLPSSSSSSSSPSTSTSALFHPKTYAPVLLRWKAHHLRTLTQDDRYVAAMVSVGMPFYERVRRGGDAFDFWGGRGRASGVAAACVLLLWR
ncbi:hypothetical protein IWZ03DRAFT_76094 [Phyllosticta citriasiana]|uniref:Uncharacterized protein n=1 Tax=Phyllosticta citriasiana TaxID=595635 RepID=A0ABR1KA56_9PEZI